MLKKMYMINSADMDYVEIDVDSNLFFAGDNGSGKTTTIRALHYLFVTHADLIGISGDQTKFNDYYFPEPKESYLIYDFGKHFILMYKSQSTIYKQFVGRELIIDRFFDDNDNLKSLKEMSQYLTAPTNKKRVDTNKDFRSIFYGDGEFSFSKIENYDTFIKLYSKLFNISKTIIDSNSIKEAIKDSIGQKDEFFEFDASSFYTSFDKLIYLDKFYKAYERNKEKIDGLKKTYHELCSLENNILTLVSQISYRYNYEQEKHKLLQDEITSIKSNIEIKTSYQRHLEKRKLYATQKIQEMIDTLNIQLKEVEQLKIEFSDNELLKNKNILFTKESLTLKQKQIQKSILEIENQYKSLIDTIENEIIQIEQSKKSEELQTKEKIALLNEQNTESSNIKYQELEFKKEKEIENVDVQLNHHKKAIAGFEKTKQNSFLDKEKIGKEYEKKLDKLREEFEKNNENIIKDTHKSNEEKYEISKTIHILENEKDKKTNQYNKIKATNEEKYEDAKKVILDKQHYYEKLFNIDENSFQAFLNENVEDWENRLYPVMDKKLLSLDIGTLEPNIKDSENLLGISINMDSLDTLPSRQQIELELEDISQKLTLMQNAYEQELKSLEKEYLNDIEEIDQKINKEKTQIEVIQLRIEEFEKKQTGLKSENNDRKESLFEQREKDKQKIDKQIELINQNINQEQSQIKKLNQQIKELNKNFVIEFNKEKKEAMEKLNNEISVLNTQLKTTINSITQKIEELENKKHTITKDEKIKQLNSELTQIEQELSKVSQSEAYFVRYEKIKNKLENKFEIEKQLENHRQFQSSCNLLISTKLKELEILIVENKQLLDEKIQQNKLYKNGIDRFNNMNINTTSSVLETDSLLDKLLSSYIQDSDLYSSKRSKFKEVFEQVFTSLKKFGKLDLAINMEYLSELNNLSNDEIIEKALYELFNYQYKIKEERRASTLELSGLVESSKQRLKNFDTSAKKLQSKMTKINARLKNVNFSIINSIQLRRQDASGNNMGSYLVELRTLLNEIEFNRENTLFEDNIKMRKDVEKIIELLKKIKNILGDNKLSSYDSSTISIEYSENNKPIKRVEQIQSQASTGTNLMLKVAITISILGEYLTNKDNLFYLIIDEVSQLHSSNQNRMREFARKNGFNIVFVAPEPTLIKPKDIRYYIFENKNAILMNHV